MLVTCRNVPVFSNGIHREISLKCAFQEWIFGEHDNEFYLRFPLCVRNLCSDCVAELNACRCAPLVKLWTLFNLSNQRRFDEFQFLTPWSNISKLYFIIVITNFQKHQSFAFSNWDKFYRPSRPKLIYKSIKKRWIQRCDLKWMSIAFVDHLLVFKSIHRTFQCEMAFFNFWIEGSIVNPINVYLNTN